MSVIRLLRLATATAMTSLLAAGTLRASPLADNVRLISATPQAALAAPDARSFSVTQAGMYTVLLTDLATPAPLSALSVGIASSTATPVRLTVSAPARSASMAVMLDAGTYTVQPLAVPAAGTGGGFTVTVTPQGNTTALFVGPWVVPADAGGSPPGQSAASFSGR